MRPGPTLVRPGLHLAHVATHRDRLTAHLGGPALWAKREDCNSGIVFGGNKTCKPEYLVAGTYGIPDETTLDAMRLAGPGPRA